MRESLIKPSDICVIEGGRSLKIKQYELYRWIRQEGFFSRDGEYYQIRGNIAYRCNAADIKDYLYENLFIVRDKNGKVRQTFEWHREWFAANSGKIVNKTNLMDSIRGKDLDKLRDTKDACFVPFLNGIVVITREGIALKSYEEVLGEKIIFEDAIIKREIDITSSFKAYSGDFADFCDKAMNGEKASGNTVSNGLTYLMRAMGYLIHEYKDPSTAKMVFFSDCNNAQGVANGRTGKSLCAKVALSQIRKLAVVDGKRFDHTDRFLFDNVDEGTDIVCLQDMRSGFNKETFYNIITGDFELKKKYQETKVLPFDKAPKVIADSNFGLSLRGGSDFARFIVIGFSHYWSKTNEPVRYYGRRFFSDWNKDQWDKFYTFMFLCVQKYLKDGVANYRLDDILAYSIYNNYPVELVMEVKDILSTPNNILTTEHESKDWWELINYWRNCDTSMPYEARMRIMRNLMYELGYKKKFRRKTIKHGSNTTEGKDTSITFHWFENNNTELAIDSVKKLNDEDIENLDHEGFK